MMETAQLYEIQRSHVKCNMNGAVKSAEGGFHSVNLGLNPKISYHGKCKLVRGLK